MRYCVTIQDLLQKVWIVTGDMIVQPLHQDHTMLIKFTNCKLTLNGKLVEKDLWIDSAKGVIVDPQKVFYDQLGMPDRIVNLGGKILAPGFIDIQINGAMGMDFSVPNADESYVKGVKIVNSALVKYGVTAYCPTLTSQTPELYRNV
jgi:N-acetylglucosamine-6-phosphate deacetylase